MNTLQVEKMIERLTILVVDANSFTRKLTRMMLTNVGAKSIYEAADGQEALAMIRTANPDVMIMDWDLPILSGAEVMRVVRSPGAFTKPNLPVIMMTRLGRRSHVRAALRLGVHEALVQPISPRALRDRLVSILTRPRPMVRIGSYYVPKPRMFLKKTDLLAAALSAYRGKRSFASTVDSGSFEQKPSSLH